MHNVVGGATTSEYQSRAILHNHIIKIKPHFTLDACLGPHPDIEPYLARMYVVNVPIYHVSNIHRLAILFQRTLHRMPPIHS